MKGINSNGTPNCVTDADTNTTYDGTGSAHFVAFQPDPLPRPYEPETTDLERRGVEGELGAVVEQHRAGARPGIEGVHRGLHVPQATRAAGRPRGPSVARPRPKPRRRSSRFGRLIYLLTGRSQPGQ